MSNSKILFSQFLKLFAITSGKIIWYIQKQKKSYFTYKYKKKVVIQTMGELQGLIEIQQQGTCILS